MPAETIVSAIPPSRIFWPTPLFFLPADAVVEESATFRQVKQFTQMMRSNGAFVWKAFVGGSNAPATTTVQAWVVEYLLDSEPSGEFCKTYAADDEMWTDE